MKMLRNVSVLVLGIAMALSFAGLSKAATTVNLGTANSFAVLAGSAITNTGSSVISGDIGSYPTMTITGFPPGTVSGTNHAGDAVTQGAKTDLTAAYTNAAGQTPVSTVPTELGGTTKTAGIYNSADGTFGITGTLTLDGQGDPNAVFIFKTASTLVTAGSSNVVLINGAQACNVFWQVGSSATLGTNSTFKGNILALTSATLTTGANVEGRVLARNGAVTLDSNIITTATCVTPPPIPQTTYAGGVVAAFPIINVVKVPTPLSLPGGPGSVAYGYTVTNIGTVAMSNITVTDDTCSNASFVSGDTNGDAKLDVNESWNYSCTTTVSKTTTNTVTATGQANGFTAIDNANATVVVGASIIPPIIHIVKKPNVFILPVGGGAVTYSYTVTNPGTAPLSNVSVFDNKCTGLPGRVVGHPGDLNNNNLLESNESWSFTCQTSLNQTTTNIGTAEGSANGLTATDFSPATVVVATPVLPNTGFPPKATSTPWSNVLLTGALGVVAISFVRVLGKVR